MAVNFMNFTKHAVCESSKLLATTGGKHIYNIKVSQDMDNGTLVARDALVKEDGEVYSMKAAGAEFEAKVIGQAGNGNYLVEVVKPGDAILLLNVPLIYEEYTKKMQAEYNFYNKKDDIVRGYELAAGDIFAISKEGITGEVAVEKKLNIASHKLNVNE